MVPQPMGYHRDANTQTETGEGQKGSSSVPCCCPMFPATAQGMSSMQPTLTIGTRHYTSDTQKIKKKSTGYWLIHFWVLLMF